MPITLSDLLRLRELQLVELVPAAARETPISWVSSSDLADPTPFLVPHQLLLTTGRQFADATTVQDAEDYVSTLAAAQVLGIGFGTEVVRDGTPPALVDACRRAGMPLVEVPYGTPFLAIIRRVAREVEHEARQREDWALAALRAISAAALARGDVPAVLRELAERLGSRVLLFDADGHLQSAFPRRRAGDPGEHLSAEVRRLLAGGARAAGKVDAGHPVTVQTIGPAGALAGALAVDGQQLDRAARTVLAAAVALVEVEVAASRRTARADLARNGGLLRLLREGREDLAHGVAAAAGTPLPGTPFTVVVTRPSERLAREALAEREVRSPGALVVLLDDAVVTIASDSAATVARRQAAWGEPVGTAQGRGWADVEVAFARAEAARRRAESGRVSAWEEVPPSVTDTGRALLPSIAATDAGAGQLRAAEVWFEVNCSWGAAGRRLRLHPHSVRDRVVALAAALGASIDDFAGRAALWGMIREFRLGGEL